MQDADGLVLHVHVLRSECQGFSKAQHRPPQHDNERPVPTTTQLIVVGVQDGLDLLLCVGLGWVPHQMYWPSRRWAAPYLSRSLEECGFSKCISTRLATASLYGAPMTTART